MGTMRQRVFPKAIPFIQRMSYVETIEAWRFKRRTRRAGAGRWEEHDP